MTAARIPRPLTRAASSAPGARRAPLARLLAWDLRVSSSIFRWYRDCAALPNSALIALEASGHGVAWVLWPLVLFTAHPRLPAAPLVALFHFYLLTLLDLAVIGVLKPTFHRTRPPYNSGLQAVTIEAVDKFSFPSGHATRAVSVAAFVLYVAATRPGSLPPWMETKLFLTTVVAWSAAVAASRVALGRHHVLDVLAGAAVGVAYVAAIDALWVPDAVVVALRDRVLSVPSLRLLAPVTCETA
jgi:presqualene diphosphate phosphatase